MVMSAGFSTIVAGSILGNDILFYCFGNYEYLTALKSLSEHDKIGN